MLLRIFRVVAVVSAIWALASVVVLAWVLAAQAQKRSATRVTSGTIAVTNTFQSALNANGNRNGCTLQNQGSHTMFIYAGQPTAATTSASLQIAPGQIFNCGANATTVITDGIAVTGTAGDGFVANEQSEQQ